MTDRELIIKTLIDAITRQSVMKADFVGLDLTEVELNRVYEVIGIRFVADNLLKPHSLTLEDVMKKYYD